MITNWLTPSSITFNTDPNNTNSDWTDTIKDVSQLIFPVLTKKNMRRISIHDVASTSVLSDTLVLSGFAIPAYTTLLGMEIKVNVRRQSRITDYVLQPFLGSTAFDNNATADGNTPNETIYGSSTSLWGISPAVNIASGTFGIYYQVGPHPQYPSSDEAIIDNVAIRLYYT
jgi:hypothetical protein